jgi:hypothetical protein
MKVLTVSYFISSRRPFSLPNDYASQYESQYASNYAGQYACYQESHHKETRFHFLSESSFISLAYGLNLRFAITSTFKGCD